MPRLELNNLLRPTTTPEQLLFLNDFYAQFDNRSAANRRIINVEPLFFQGAIAGTEFLTYAATKLYICLSLSFGQVAINAAPSNATYYDAANVIFYIIANQSVIWDATAAAPKYEANFFNDSNIWFSRFAVANLNTMKFIGYRVTLV
jgi:hypothetical protein